jgi:alkylhydroperoxidase family enzyme
VSWIETIAPDAAGDELATLYAKMVDPDTGELDNVLRVHSLHPAGLAAHWELYRAVMRPSRTLRKAEREMIALVVSRINECHY